MHSQFSDITGESHMDTLKTLNNLALLYNKKCDYKRAEELYKRCLDRFQESMGKDHELTIRVRNNLAGLYAAQGENEVAKEHYDLCLQSSERNFRRIGVLDDNALSASIKNNFAVLLQRMNLVDEAEKLLDDCKEYRKKLSSKSTDNTSLNSRRGQASPRKSYSPSKRLKSTSLTKIECSNDTCSADGLLNIFQNPLSCDELYYDYCPLEFIDCGTEHDVPSCDTLLDTLICSNGVVTPEVNGNSLSDLEDSDHQDELKLDSLIKVPIFFTTEKRELKLDETAQGIIDDFCDSNAEGLGVMNNFGSLLFAEAMQEVPRNVNFSKY